MFSRAIAGLLLISFLAATPAGAFTATLGAGGGVGYMPMNDWEDFWTSLPDAHYSSDDATLYLDVLARVRLGGKHGLRVSYGRIFREADLTAVEVLIPGPGTQTFIAEYDFRTAPFGVAYEFFFNGFDNQTSTVAGLGASVYFTTLEAKTRDVGPVAFPNPPETLKRSGEGLGVEVFVGQRAKVRDQLSINVQLRGRWADGLLFSDDTGDVKVEFSGIDVSVFGEWFFR